MTPEKKGPATIRIVAKAQRSGSRQNRTNHKTSQDTLQFKATVQALRDRIETLAIELLGTPSSSTSTEMRWGKRGSLVVNFAGERAGRWRSFETGEGGDALDLIAYARGGDLKDAYLWARSWLGVTQ
jgi:hypothetical protein